MPARDLNELTHLIVMYTQHQIDIAERQESVADLGKLHREIAEHFRALGICTLLTRMDTEAFHRCLVQAAITRRHYLRRCQAELEFSHRNYRASFIDPFFDAVTANQFGLAAEIAELSPAEWREGFEYPDDFQCARIFYELVLGRSDAAAVEAMLLDFETALEGGEDQRLGICQGLVRRDQAVFDEALDALIEERDRRMDDIVTADLDAISDYVFEPNRLVYIEGLAILRLAEQRGLKTRQEYPLCQGIARLRGERAFEPMAWPDEGLSAEA